MKKLNLLFGILIGLAILSCSSDNGNGPIEEPSENTGKILSKILQKTYDQGVLAERITFVYENSKPKIDSFYNSNNELTYYSKWVYDNNGLLSSVKGYLPNGEINYESIINYDNSNRIIQNIRIEEKGAYTTTIDYTYNSDNTISSVTNSNGNSSSKTFKLNNSGLIFKEIRDNYISEVEFDSDNNPIQKTTTYSTTMYTVNNDVLKEGVFLDLWKNIFGTEINNTVLWGNSLDDYADSYGNKYIIIEENGNNTNNFEYSFDSQNYPTKKSSFNNNELTSELEYIYE